MNILWITNNCIGYARECLGIKNASGTWLEAALSSFSARTDISLSIAFTSNVKERIEFNNGSVFYYCLPRRNKKAYQYNSSKCKEDWRWVISNSKPDLFMIWGTEYTHGLCAMQVAPHIPSVIVIQGIIDSIYRFYLGGLSFKELLTAYSLRNFLKKDSILATRKLYYKRLLTEKKMLCQAKNVIVENEWSQALCKNINRECRFFEYRQTVNTVFWENKWDASNCHKRTIFCSSPVNYPLKGFHQMIKALSVIKKECLDVQLRVPGMDNPFHCSFFQKFKQNGYIKYIKSLIVNLDLADNIVFLGKLNSAQISEELLHANVFVVPSCIENLSISLREAMVVGTPAVSSFVGGLPETIQDRENGRLYRFEDFFHLAEIIMSIFNDEKQALKYSENARKTMRSYLSIKSDPNTLISIYKEILSQ